MLLKGKINGEVVYCRGQDYPVLDAVINCTKGYCKEIKTKQYCQDKLKGTKVDDG